jgi:pyruvate kinase
MDVARLNFSHGSYEDHAQTIANLRAISGELDTPVTILQDLQGTDRQGEVAAFCDSTDHWLPLVCTMNVTVATEQIRKLFGWSIEQFNEAIRTAPAATSAMPSPV